MPQYPTGIRVGALLSSEDGVVDFLGYGVYLGDVIPEDAVGWIAEMLRESQTTNPCIKLDSGKYVFGCECWWGPEEDFQKILAKATQVNHFDIEEVRKKHLEEQAEPETQGFPELN